MLSILLQIDWADLQYTVDDFSRTIYSFPIHIRVLLAITLIFLLIILILLGIVLSSRIYKTSRAIKREELRIKYQNVLRILLFEDLTSATHSDHTSATLSDHTPATLSDRTSATHSVQNGNSGLVSFFDAKDLEEGFSRETIMNEIIHLHENFTGETAERLEEIYIALNFHLDSIKKLKNKRWYVVAKGMRELALMNVKQALPEVSGFINNKNEILRMESRIAIMKLSEHDHLSFLALETTPLTGWDTANIHSMLSKMPEKSIPDFSTWLNSSNKDVVLFCIQMIGTYRQHDSAIKLIDLLRSKDENIRFAVIKSLRSLSSNASEEPLIEMYDKESLRNRTEILITLEVIGSTKTVSFLERIINKPIEDYPLVIQAVRALMATGNAGQSIIERIYQQSGAQMQLVINHAKDKRL